MIRVLVAEDMRILRDTLAALHFDDDIEVVAEVTDGSAIVPAVPAQEPDVAVVDIDLPSTACDQHAKRGRAPQPQRLLLLRGRARASHPPGPRDRMLSLVSGRAPLGADIPLSLVRGMGCGWCPSRQRRRRPLPGVTTWPPAGS